MEAALHTGNNVDILREHVSDGAVHLTVTSPPYDELRTYEGFEWDFPSLASELWRITCDGGVVVWVVADSVVGGSETGSSFRQALHFMETGFSLHDTMIWSKPSLARPPRSNSYSDSFEYMFVLSKGRPRTVNLLADRCNDTAGTLTSRGGTRRADGSRAERNRIIRGRTPLFSRRFNVWQVSQQQSDFHPAPFPLRLAADHVHSWSNPGDLVCDPFLGSGTTAIAAVSQGRRFIGIDISPAYVHKANERLAKELAATT